MVRVLGKLTVFTLFSLIFARPGFAVDRIPVFVSIVPQKYFVQQIGGDLVDVHVMVQPGANLHAYEPRPKQMADLSKARVYFAIGDPSEHAWLKKVAAASPKMRVVHTDHGIEKIPMTTHHNHDEEGEHNEKEQAGHGRDEGQGKPGNLDPHIWLSPPLVKIQARTILNALQEIDSLHRTIYEVNYNQLVSGIDELDAQLKATFAGKQGLQFMVFHPAWGYFADAYGLEQVPIEIEGKDPKPAQLKALIEHAREKGIKVVFVQPQFSAKSAEVVAREIGGQVAFADSLAEDWMASMREVAEKFKAALK
ncbi:MAG: cation ABC transporter substrate-binding protein [Desulfobacteraceae bacterium]|nr:MAG: cation ABC transporter substrate-binding protein [Desulfobacteraceae bacterium]